MSIQVTMLKRKYNEAVREGKDQFTIECDGQERVLLTSYAKYLIEYLADKKAQEFSFQSSA